MKHADHVYCLNLNNKKVERSYSKCGMTRRDMVDTVLQVQPEKEKKKPRSIESKK